MEDEQVQSVAEEYKPGELAPSIITSAKVWKPDDLKKLDPALEALLVSLARECSSTDEAARRFSILQTWQNRHMDRGYQYLEDNGHGGWSIAGTNSTKNANSLSAGDDANLYPTNIMAAQGDIACGALRRGEIKVNFFPPRSKDPMEVACADEANRYKHIWRKNNPNLQSEIADLGWTDCRVLVWTRSVADCARFGYADGPGGDDPRVVELSTSHGVMETKLPMMADTLAQCGFAQIFEEMDYAVARAAYPWMGDKIKPAWGTPGELEFERIARINTRIGIVGRYITGTSGLRETTMGYTWLRPGMFFDDRVPKPQREVLLREFPSGVFLVCSGQSLCCCWDEAMDDHLAHGMYVRGFGQNRRSMGENDVPLQKRINIWADLWDKTVRSAIAATAVDNQAFNPEAMAQQEASPTRYIPVEVPEGRPMTDLMAPMPVAQLHPGFAEMFQWYLGPLIQSIDGATPALFGGGEGQDNTVGATQIRLQQSLERYGTPWQMANRVVASAARQAAKCCGENGNSEISDNIPGEGDVSVNPANLRGNPNCEPETLAMIPQSGAQREAKVMQILDMANQSPQIAGLVGTPSNAREIVKALHVDDVITIDEADSEDLALENVERLLEAEPLINPAWAQLNQQIEELDATHEQAKQLALTVTQSGEALAPGEIEQGNAMEQQLMQLQQQLGQMPQYLPSVPVPDDESIDYVTIAATIFSWMQQPAGRQLRRKAEGKPETDPDWKRWTNVYLYWKSCKEMAAKFTKAQGPPPRISMTGKLSPEQQAQLLLMQAGIQSAPQDGAQGHEAEIETIQRTPYAEVKQKMRKRL